MDPQQRRWLNRNGAILAILAILDASGAHKLEEAENEFLDA